VAYARFNEPRAVHGGILSLTATLTFEMTMFNGLVDYAALRRKVLRLITIIKNQKIISYGAVVVEILFLRLTND
jgi:hypothetical protein